MTTIYCIEDINDLKYVGSTINKLNVRLAKHRYDKKTNRYKSSSKLNLENCIIYPLETCSESDRFEREKYWINKIECVNQIKFNFDQKEWNKNNREKINETQRKYRKNNLEKNKEKIDEQNRNYYINRVVKSVLDDMITHIELNQLDTFES